MDKITIKVGEKIIKI